VLEVIRQFIAALPARQSHYSRERNNQRKFLDANTTKRSLFRQLLLLNPELLEANDNNTAATYHLFCRTFNFEFNVAIGFPRSDLCDTCELLKYQIAAATRERNEPMQQQLQQQRMQHWTESEVFYNELRAANNIDYENGDIIVCADYEKNFPFQFPV